MLDQLELNATKRKGQARTFEDPASSSSFVATNRQFSFFSRLQLFSLRSNDPDLEERSGFAHRPFLDFHTVPVPHHDDTLRLTPSISNRESSCIPPFLDDGRIEWFSSSDNVVQGLEGVSFEVLERRLSTESSVDCRRSTEGLDRIPVECVDEVLS